MKKLFIIILLSFISYSFCSAEYTVQTKINITTKFGYSYDKLVFGIHEKATDSLDTELGEVEIPPFPPPEGVQAGFWIFDPRQGERVFTFLDLRRVPANSDQEVVYGFDLQKMNGDIATFQWFPLGNNIVSAFITDNITGTIVVINMKDSVKATVDNEFVDHFIIKVKYNVGSGLTDENQKNENSSEIFPNPVNSSFRIKSDRFPAVFKVISPVGVIALFGNLDKSESVNVSDLPNGLYILEIIYPDGTKDCLKFIKL